jgi:hypothetical protein
MSDNTIYDFCKLDFVEKHIIKTLTKDIKKLQRAADAGIGYWSKVSKNILNEKHESFSICSDVKLLKELCNDSNKGLDKKYCVSPILSSVKNAEIMLIPAKYYLYSLENVKLRLETLNALKKYLSEINVKMIYEQIIKDKNLNKNVESIVVPPRSVNNAELFPEFVISSTFGKVGQALRYRVDEVGSGMFDEDLTTYLTTSGYCCHLNSKHFRSGKVSEFLCDSVRVALKNSLGKEFKRTIVTCKLKPKKGRRNSVYKLEYRAPKATASRCRTRCPWGVRATEPDYEPSAQVSWSTKLGVGLINYISSELQVEDGVPKVIWYLEKTRNENTPTFVATGDINECQKLFRKNCELLVTNSILKYYDSLF